MRYGEIMKTSIRQLESWEAIDKPTIVIKIFLGPKRYFQIQKCVLKKI